MCQAQGVFHLRLQGHGSYSSNIPMQLTSHHLEREVNGNGTLVPDKSRTCQASYVPWLSLSNITTYPSLPHTLSFRTPPNHGQVGRIPLCLNLHYSTYHSSKKAVTHNVKGTSLGSKEDWSVDLALPAHHWVTSVRYFIAQSLSHLSGKLHRNGMRIKSSPKSSGPCSND